MAHLLDLLKERALLCDGDGDCRHFSPGRPQLRCSRRTWQACWATQERLPPQRPQVPASQRAGPRRRRRRDRRRPQVQRNLRTRLCLISKPNNHEDYQLARGLLPLHNLCGHDVDNDDGQRSRTFLM